MILANAFLEMGEIAEEKRKLKCIRPREDSNLWGLATPPVRHLQVTIIVFGIALRGLLLINKIELFILQFKISESS